MSLAEVTDILIKSSSDGIFKQAFLKAYAEISRENSNEIAGSQRRNLPEDTREDLRFQERAARGPQMSRSSRQLRSTAAHGARVLRAWPPRQSARHRYACG